MYSVLYRIEKIILRWFLFFEMHFEMYKGVDCIGWTDEIESGSGSLVDAETECDREWGCTGFNYNQKESTYTMYYFIAIETLHHCKKNSDDWDIHLYHSTHTKDMSNNFHKSCFFFTPRMGLQKCGHNESSIYRCYFEKL